MLLSILNQGCTNGLSCYTCLSKNKSDSLCEDPFSDNFRPFATDRKVIYSQKVTASDISRYITTANTY